MQQIVPIIKIVSMKCNLRCAYCYYREEDQSATKIINFKSLKELIRKTLDNFSGRVQFIWHGGEPLLVGIDFYREVLKLQQLYKKESHQIINALQTNATLLNERWVKFLKDNSFNIGVSCDGPEKYHDKCRRDKQNTGTFQRVFRGIKLLQAKGINPHVIMIVTKDKLNSPKEIYKFLYENNLSFHPKPCLEIDPKTNRLSAYSITPEEYTGFMIKIFDLWIETDNPNFKIRNLDNILTGLLGGKPNLCEFNGKCQKFLTVDYNGDIGHCDSFPLQKFRFGNILKDDWFSILKTDDYRLYLECIKFSRQDCKGCEWLIVCKGGCLRYSYTREENQWHKNIFCESRKKLFNHVAKKLKEIESLSNF